MELQRRGMEIKAKEWLDLGRGLGGLLDRVELPEAERWLQIPDAANLGYSEVVPALVRASRERIDAEDAATRRRSRITFMPWRRAWCFSQGWPSGPSRKRTRPASKAHVSNANLAQKTWEDGDIDSARRSLKQQRTGWFSFNGDLRGFEWYLWWRLCHRERPAILDHDDRVLGVAFVDEQSLLSVTEQANKRGQVRKWDLNGGHELAPAFQNPPVKTDGATVEIPGISPRGKVLAFGTARKVDRKPVVASVVLWDIAAGKQPAVLVERLNGGSHAWRFLPMGNCSPRGAETIPAGGAIRVWDVATGRLRHSRKLTTDSVRAVAFEGSSAWLSRLRKR